MGKGFKAFILAGACAVGAWSSSASAAIQITGWSRNPVPPVVYGGYTIANLSAHEDGDAGRFLSTGFDTITSAPVSLYSYCADLLTGYNTYVNFVDSPISALIADAAKQSQLAALLVHGDALIAGAATADDARNISAALSISVWEIIYETGTSGYDVGTGNFIVNGDAAAPAVSLKANDYLTWSTNGTWTAPTSSVRALIPEFSDGLPLSQAQIFVTTSAIPEPSTWAMMLLAFGAVGSMLRRRARRQLLTAA